MTFTYARHTLLTLNWGEDTGEWGEWSPQSTMETQQSMAVYSQTALSSTVWTCSLFNSSMDSDNKTMHWNELEQSKEDYTEMAFSQFSQTEYISKALTLNKYRPKFPQSSVPFVRQKLIYDKKKKKRLQLKTFNI